jgi:hypothetical protein
MQRSFREIRQSRYLIIDKNRNHYRRKTNCETVGTFDDNLLPIISYRIMAILMMRTSVSGSDCQIWKRTEN